MEFGNDCIVTPASRDYWESKLREERKNMEYRFAEQRKEGEWVKMQDEVNHPSHYCKGGIECIDVIEAATAELKGIEAVCTANIIKYIFRWKDKNGVTDVKKCKWYCERLIKELEKTNG